MIQLWHDLNQVHVTLRLGHTVVIFLAVRIAMTLWLLVRENRRETKDPLSQQRRHW